MSTESALGLAWGPALFLAAALHAAQPFPEPFDSEKSASRPLPAAEVAKAIAMPAGFKATAFACEPDVRQPIAMATDARGRLWVVENYTYAETAVNFHAGLRDRIVVFEDADNDGHFDRRTVFWDQGQRVTSIEIGLGGVWVLCPPQLLFIPDRDGDAVPDGEPEVVLDGFEYTKARHNIANGLKFGPDGWLYGRHGILGTSNVGRPGSMPADRVAMNVGIWRYHPQRRMFECVAQGTTNPWGMDWDARGEAFFINTVIGHLWHVIPGAHYRRMFGDDPDSHVYEPMEQHADHVHWATGELWTDVRRGATDATLAAGGGHAHSGLLIYQGGQWPAEWSGKLLTVNFHGRRFNVERLDRVGGGFVGRHEHDAFAFNDPWFRGIDLIAAPDGGIFVSDWSDTGECHDHDGVSRSTGRIYKIVYGSPPKRAPNLVELPSVELARRQTSANDWESRQARRVLQERTLAGKDVRAAAAELERLVADAANPVHRLRALWALHVCGVTRVERLLALLGDKEEAMRIWAIRLLADLRSADPSNWRTIARGPLARLAGHETSGLVRLTIASVLQTVPAADREPLAAGLLAHSEDATDANIPLMLWYAVEPMYDEGPVFDRLVAAARLPRMQRLAVRRLAEEIDTALPRLDALLGSAARSADPDLQRAVLDGLEIGLGGRQHAPRPESWPLFVSTVSRQPALAPRLDDLSALFGDGRALEKIRVLALDANAAVARRRSALKTLVAMHPAGLREVCESLLPVPGLAVPAAMGLALDSDPGVADRILAQWPRLDPNDRPAVMDVLISRPGWAAQMLAAMMKGRVNRADLSVLQARQIRAHADSQLNSELTETWGLVRDLSTTEKTGLLAKWQGILTPERLKVADRARGRTVFRATCGVCHTLNGEGASIGPDLTGGDRGNRDYLLENILFPSALVPREYRQTTLKLRDGRVLVGSLRGRSSKAVKLQTGTDVATIAAADIAGEDTSNLSLMPEGLLDALGVDATADLFGYLMAK